MAIFIGSDHRGFKIKEAIKTYLAQNGYQAIDLGNLKYEEDDDYPDFASLVAEKVSSDFINSKGIVFCASGVGVDIVANKFPNIRCVLACSSDQAVFRHPVREDRAHGSCAHNNPCAPPNRPGKGCRPCVRGRSRSARSHSNADEAGAGRCPSGV